MRKSHYIFLLIVLMFVVGYSSCSTNTYMGRIVKWRSSDIEDYKKFPETTFNSSKKPYLFIEGLDPAFDTIRVTKKGEKTPFN